MAMAVSNQQSRDAALLRATTELFVLEATHDPDEIRRFEELATHFLGRVSAADRAFVAERLSKSADAPGSILRLLGKDLVEIATPILKRSPALTEFDFLTIMASTGAAHHRQIATRGDLSALVVAALRLTGDKEVIARVAAYPAVMTESDALVAEAEADEAAELDEAPAPLPARVAAMLEPEPEAAYSGESLEFAGTDEPDAIQEPGQGHAPGADQDIAPPITPDEPAGDPITAEALEIFAAVRAIASSFDETRRPAAPADSAAQPYLAEPSSPATPAGFLGLDRAGRIDALRRLGESPSPRHEGSGVIDADQAFRQALGRARLASLARQRQRDALIRTLAQGLRLAEADVTALMDDPSGEALVVLLRAIGLAEGEAQQVLLFANPVIAAGVESFERLARLLGDTSDSVAADLVGLWRDGERRQPAHLPHFADVELRRTMHPISAETTATPPPAAYAQDPPERRVFGLRGR